MAQPQPTSNPRIIRLIELEAKGVLKPDHQAELDSYRTRGIISTPKPATEGERKASAFLTRAVGANKDYEQTGVGPRSLIGQSLADTAPSILNSLPGGVGNSPERQMADTAQDEFIAASLRQDSGAAIPDAELERQRRIYFPMPGDGSEVMAQKDAARRRAIQGLVESGGTAVNPAQRTLTDETLKGRFHPSSGDGTVTVGGFADELPADPLQQLKPEDRTAYWQLEKVAKTPGELVGFMADRGFSMDPARARSIIEARDKGASLDGRAMVVEPMRPIDRGEGRTGAALRGFGDTATFGFLDEAGAVADTLAGHGGDGGFKDRLYRNIDANRAIFAGDEQNHGGARIAGQLAGGLAIPFGAGARTPNALARVGALSGAAYGFGSGEGDALARLPSALGSAAAGGLGGYTFGQLARPVGNALARFAPSPSGVRQEANALAGAAARRDVPLTAADIRPGARNALAFLEASPGGNGPARDALSAGNDALEAAVGRLGQGGTAGSSTTIGDTVQGAARRAVEWSRGEKDRLYGRAEQLAGGTSVSSDRAVGALDQHIAELAQTPAANRGVLGLLTDLRGDLVDEAGNVRPLSIQSIRNLRTAMRGEIGTRNLTMTDAERRISGVIDAASDDITHGLIDAGRDEAAQAYRRADAFYRERQQVIGDVLQRFIGRRDSPLSGEQTYAKLTSMMGNNGDSRRLGQMMRLLTPDEQSDVAATVAGQLGRRAPDDDFSPARFVTMAEKLSPDARRTVFGDDGADAIGDLLRLSTARRDTIARLNNSRSGQVANYNNALSGIFGLLGAGSGYAAGGVGGAAFGAVAAGTAKAGVLNLSARLLTNQGFVRWLGRAPTATTPAQVEGRLRELGNLAVRQPVIRGEIASLQRLLGETGVSRSFAAEGGEGDQQDRYRREPMPAGR